MQAWEKEQEIIDLRNSLTYELKLYAMSYTDFDRKTIIETEDGYEEIVLAKEISYEAEPNARPGATDRIIKEFTEKLGWEYINSEKRAWVNGYIKHIIYFKL